MFACFCAHYKSYTFTLWMAKQLCKINVITALSANLLNVFLSHATVRDKFYSQTTARRLCFAFQMPNIRQILRVCEHKLQAL